MGTKTDFIYDGVTPDKRLKWTLSYHAIYIVLVKTEGNLHMREMFSYCRCYFSSFTYSTSWNNNYHPLCWHIRLYSPKQRVSVHDAFFAMFAWISCFTYKLIASACVQTICAYAEKKQHMHANLHMQIVHRDINND